jgi:hypothetical protein
MVILLISETCSDKYLFPVFICFTISNVKQFKENLTWGIHRKAHKLAKINAIVSAIVSAIDCGKLFYSIGCNFRS